MTPRECRYMSDHVHAAVHEQRDHRQEAQAGAAVDQVALDEHLDDVQAEQREQHVHPVHLVLAGVGRQAVLALTAAHVDGAGDLRAAEREEDAGHGRDQEGGPGEAQPHEEPEADLALDGGAEAPDEEDQAEERQGRGEGGFDGQEVGEDDVVNGAEEVHVRAG